MKTMFVISPNYLEAIKQESTRYRKFYIQGYSDIYSGYDGLFKVNQSQVLGYCFLFENSKQAEELYNFLNILNFISTDKVSVSIVFKEEVSEEDYEEEFDEFKSLSIQIVSGAKIITDVVIRNNLFGFILKKSNSPYPLYSKDKGENIDMIFRIERNELKPFLPELYFLFEPINLLDNYSDSLISDVNIEKVASDYYLYYLRDLMIKSKFVNVTKDLEKFRKILLNLDEPRQTYYSCLLEYCMKEGYIECI